jgi:hypothetical protein
MKMPGMRVEIRGFEKRKIDDRRIGGGPGDVTRLIQIVTIVVSSQLRPNQVEHSRGDLLSVDPLLAQDGSAKGERLKSVDNRLVVGHRRLPPARGYLLKRVLPETLVDAIRVLAAGGTYLYSPPEGTVKNHISSIFSKLGVTDRTKAVLHAIVKGLV